MLKSGDIVLVNMQFTDTFEVKKRPALVLYEDFGNIVVAGITSNKNMKGIPIYRKEGALKDCVIKLNYIFTMAEVLIERKLFSLSKEKKKLVFNNMVTKLEDLNK